MQQLEDTFKIASAPDIELGMSDPNNSSALASEGGGPFKGKDVPQFGQFKITKTDLSGPSGQPQGSTFDESTPGMKAMMPTANDDGGKGENGFNIDRNVPILTFGDPNNTADDAKDVINNEDPFSNYPGSYDFKGSHDPKKNKSNVE